ncbi:heme-binding protein [Pseudoalteromonas sp. T1lg23B]|uniref:heme-binding protein n=1 Tax=Pseudoalteromonas sp. T1lg23B TaxID=2077097 RepID=UPI001F436CB4|nr:heme-binding protein [Pseudoalteromonas sp. T1lg23B]
MSNSGHEKQQVSKRSLTTPCTTEPALGPLSQLPGVWKNSGQFHGHGWNMIALPFPSGDHDYRLLNNQYNETLTFQLVDKNVPNRGMNGDQEVFTVDYVQAIDQIAAADFPESGLAGEAGLAIHHEPGLWLHMKNHTTGELDIARLSSIPHGDAVMALGKVKKATLALIFQALVVYPLALIRTCTTRILSLIYISTSSYFRGYSILQNQMNYLIRPFCPSFSRIK